MLNSNTCNHLTLCTQMNSNSFKNKVTYELITYIICEGCSKSFLTFLVQAFKIVVDS